MVGGYLNSQVPLIYKSYVRDLKIILGEECVTTQFV